VFELGERLLGQGADLGGEAGRVLVGQDPMADVLDQPTCASS
jgi:hypothetical protein